jgi:hypothetical protein
VATEGSGYRWLSGRGPRRQDLTWLSEGGCPYLARVKNARWSNVRTRASPCGSLCGGCAAWTYRRGGYSSEGNTSNTSTTQSVPRIVT